MSLKPLLSFSGGELDPILHDNVTLEKFNKGLATARNVLISKTGSIQSRFPRYHLATGKESGRAIKLYCPPDSNALLEFGHEYVRIYYTSVDYSDFYYPFSLSLLKELTTHFKESDLPNLHFDTGKDYVYVFCKGKKMLKINFNGPTGIVIVDESDMFSIPHFPSSLDITPSGSPTGFPAYFYAVTFVVNGEESLPIFSSMSYQRPAAVGQTIKVEATYTNSTDRVNEMRVYIAPMGGSGFGLLGTTSVTFDGSATWTGELLDLGSNADYAQGLQVSVTDYGLQGAQVIDLKPKTGAIYQQRLILGNVEGDEEALVASRPGYHNNFYRDFPYTVDSALHFKSGSSGKAKVLRIVESDGLIVFTSVGVYTSVGLLNVNNLALDKRGPWIIKEGIPPLVVPGGVFFVDKSNVIRQLIFSQDIMAYESLEQTIFSNHLFKKRTIKSWAFQNGSIPLLIVTFSDGQFATFTYNFEHQMKAWTRHDSKYPVEQVEGTTFNDISYFVINKNGTRYIECSIPRDATADAYEETEETEWLPSRVFMDSIKTQGFAFFNNEIKVEGDNLILLQGDELPIIPDGTILRWFDPENMNAIDLTILSYDGYDNGDRYIVEASEPFPENYLDVNTHVYSTDNVIHNLGHLEGEEVSVIVDGALVASPNNDKDGYPKLVVENGELTLPDGMLGAIIHVGRPITADVETLNISTVEQSPTLIESVNVNKLYINVNDTVGLYCANKFPKGNGITGMDDLHKQNAPLDEDLIGNKAPVPFSERIEKSIMGSWDSNGRIAIRQVDPFHFEILSIIPDVTVLRRSDR